MLTSTRLFATVFSLSILSAAVSGQTTGQNGVDPSALSASYGFGQHVQGIALSESGTHYVFGGRGGDYLGTSERWYVGGGGRGGSSIDDSDGGLGYGYFQVGQRGPVGTTDIGLDLYGGLGFGGYGSEETEGQLMAGPVAGIATYWGANRGFEVGLHAETLVNAADLSGSVLSIGFHIGGKGGSATIPWEKRRDAGLGDRDQR